LQKRKLGKTDLELTPIGLGSLAMGSGNWFYRWGKQDDEDSEKTIKKAIEFGVNWIDTAPVYGLGHSEELIGKVLPTLPIKPIISTTCGIIWTESKSIRHSLKRHSVQSQIDASLRRLGVDVIDLYLLQTPSPEKELLEGWNEIANQIQKGKIRYAGVANFPLPLLQNLHKIHPVSALQIAYNITNRSIEDSIINYCAQENIGIIVYDSLAKGLLTGKLNEEQTSKFKERHQRLPEALQLLLNKKDITLPQLAIAWCLRNPVVASVIVGSRIPEQVDEAVKAAGISLSLEEREFIYNQAPKRHTKQK